MDKTNLSKLIIKELGWRKSPFREGWYSCPYHAGDKTPSLHADYANGLFHCFGCGKGGNLTTAFWEERGESAYKYFGIQKDGSALYTSKETISQIVDEEELYEEAPDVKLTVGENIIKATNSALAVNYLASRGLPSSVISKYNIFYCDKEKVVDDLNTNLPLNKRTTWFENRLMIPIYENKNLISIEGRDVLNNSKNLPKELYHKVLYPKGSSLKTLYNLEKLDRNQPLYLTEGLMDLMALQTHPSFKNCTTIFGAGVNDRQLYLLNKFPEVIYIINNDTAGWKSLKNVGRGYKGLLRYAVPPKGCDDIGDIIHPLKYNSTINQEIENGWLRRLMVFSEN